MTIDQTRRRKGTSDPLDFRNARPVGHRVGKVATPDTNLYGGNLATNDPGTHFTNGTACIAEEAIAGALLVRIRGLFTGGGTLSFKYLRPASARNPDSTGAGYAYSTALDTPHADVVVVANTEFLADIESGGESDLLLTFTPTADGVVTWLDISQQ